LTHRSSRAIELGCILGKLIPHFPIQLAAALQPFAGLLRIKAQKVAQLHRDALRIAKLTVSAFRAVKGQPVKLPAELIKFGVKSGAYSCG
jgi:hypothetical protein